MAKINLYLSYAVSSNTATSIDTGETYTTTITPLDGYIFNTHDIIAIMDGGTVTVDKSTSEVSISATVTGDITIVVNALYCYARFDGSFFGSGAHLITASAYSVDAIQSVLSNEISLIVESIDAPTNVKLVDSILSWDAVANAKSYSVYKGSEKLAENITSTSVDLLDYINTVGFFVISVSAVSKESDIESKTSESVYFETKAIWYDLTNCVSDNKRTIVPRGSQYIAILTPDDGYAFTSGRKDRVVVNVPSVNADATRIAQTATKIVKETLIAPTQTLNGNKLTINTNNTESKASSYVLSSGDDTLVTFHTIQTEYYGVTTSMPIASNVVLENSRYSVIFTAEDGYTLDGGRVIVTMGGVDITSTVYTYDGAGRVVIPSVTAPVDILVIGKVVK